MAVDTESRLITAVDVVAGNAPDNRGALGLVEASERDAAAKVSETVADCAYGDGATRQAYADAGRDLIAKVAVTRNGGCFPKTDFTIDLDAERCICPAGRQGIAGYRRPTAPGERRVLRGFRFRAEDCTACPLRPRCVRGRGARTIAVHPQEALIQQARALQAGPDFAPYRRARQAAEHRLARLVQLGIRQARYVGRAKTRFQLLMAATVANLTLLAGHARAAGGETPPSPSATLLSALCSLIALQIVIWPLEGTRASTPRSDARVPAWSSSTLFPRGQMAACRPYF